METRVIDEFIKDKDIFKYLTDYVLKVPHFFTNQSMPGTSFFYESPLDPYNPFHDLLFAKFCCIYNPNKSVLVLDRMYLNIQHIGMTGTYHRDDGDVTGLVFIRGSGSFEIKGETEFEFVPNRLIIFDKSKFHRGNAPVQGGPRVTLAFKCRLV